MSLRAKKVSAFSVFSKSRKATSLSNMAVEGTPKLSLGQKSKSASTTPTNSRDGSLASSTPSTDKKKRSEIKKIKKLLKSATKKRPSFLPEIHAMQSPLLGHMNNNGVELRSLRPKRSIVTRNSSQPLKATADCVTDASLVSSPSVDVCHGDGSSVMSKQRLLLANGQTTPPLPPKAVRAVKPSLKDTPVLTGQKRGSLLFAEDDSFMVTPDLPPRGSRLSAQSGSNRLRSPVTSDSELFPPRPAKRRRVSQGSAPPSPAKFKDSSVLSLDGSRERLEPMPSYPSIAQPYMFDSKDEARRLFECLIHPVVPNKFFNELWEKKPLLVKRHQLDYNNGWFSTADFDKILRQEHIKFSENLDVVSYESGKRETHNPTGRAHASVVWDYYQNGCSIRLLNPQTYDKNVWKLLSILQEYFGCCVGANVYLTPPGTQGFAPHWDDIEAFILQLEGKKHWKLYSPRTENEVLPRFSSDNFNDENIGEPILDVILEAGDLLYFPRGTIHQGRTLDDEHSLHITVSCYQKNTWGDVMELLVPQALQIALSEDVEFRKALPKEYLGYMGVAYSDKDCPERQAFLRRVEQLMQKLISYAPVDSACDQMGKKYIKDSLPPFLTEAEKFCSIHGQGERWDAGEKRVVHSVELDPDTNIKLIRGGCLRLVTEEDKICVYHNLENARIYHAHELQNVEVTPEMAPAVEYLIHSYPEFVSIESLPLEQIQDKVQLVSVLYDKGLIITQEPLEHLSDTASESEKPILPPPPKSSSKPVRPASKKVRILDAS